MFRNHDDQKCRQPTLTIILSPQDQSLGVFVTAVICKDALVLLTKSDL